MFLGRSSVSAAKLSFLDPQGFGSILEQNLAKTMKVQTKNSFSAKTLEACKKTQKTKFWSLELPNYTMLQKFCFCNFLGTHQHFGTETSVFWDPFKVSGAFWSKTLPKPWRVPKTTKVLVPKHWRVPNKKIGVYPMLQKPVFWKGLLGPSSVLAPKLSFFEPLKVLGACWSKALPKPWMASKKKKGSPKTRKKQVLEEWVVWQLKAPICFVLFWTLQCFGTKTLVVLGPSMVLARFCSKMLPKP